MNTKETSTMPDAEAIAALRETIKEGLTLTATAARTDSKTGKKRLPLAYYRPPISIIWDVVTLYKACNKASTIATVVVNAIGNKFKHIQSKLATDDEKLSVAMAYVMKLGLGAAGAAMKKKREAAMGRCVPICMAGGVDMSNAWQEFFVELASSESPYADDDSLKAALVGHGVMEEDEELNAWLKG